jgi:hypothetical protein
VSSGVACRPHCQSAGFNDTLFVLCFLPVILKFGFISLVWCTAPGLCYACVAAERLGSHLQLSLLLSPVQCY